MTRLTLFAFVLFLFPAISAQTQNRTGSLSGVVVDRETREPLIGANVVLQGINVGDATDVKGNFSVRNIPAGIYTVIVKYVGYRTRYLPDIVIGSNRNQYINVELNLTVLDGEEVLVTSGYFSGTDGADISRVSFSPEEIRRSPGAAQALGRVLTALPGVASRGEISQNLMVRGGSPMENGFYIDNIPIPEIRHFRIEGGTSSGPIGIINTELVDDIDFSTGGFSVAYGDRLSSISNINYRDGTKERLRGDIGANLAGFNLSAEGPYANKKGSFLISIRRSYLDIIADAINTGGAPIFGDIQGKMVYDINQNNRLSLLNVYGSSLFESSISEARDEGTPDAVQYESEQNTTGLNWRRLWKNGYTNTSVSYSFRTEDRLLRDVITEVPSNSYDTNRQDIAIRSVSFHRINEKNSIEFGTDLSYEMSDFDYFIAGGINPSGTQRPDYSRNDEINGALAAVFFSYTLKPLSKLTATFGSRLGWNSYNEDFYPDANIQLRYQLTPRLAMNGAFGMYHQTVPRYLLSQNSVFENLKNIRATHYIAGFDYILTDDTKLTLEAFEKYYDNAPILPENNTLGNPSFVLDNVGVFYEALDDNGTASARGIELLIQKKLAVNFYGMISASYFRARYRDFEDQLQRSDFDNRYLVSLIGGYRPNDKWEISARWTLMGGRSYTPIDAEASAQAGSEVVDMSRFNKERLPDYHSLYLRVDRRFFLNRTNLVIFLEAWNAYNHSNVDAYYWNVISKEIDEATQFSFLPVGGVKFEF